MFFCMGITQNPNKVELIRNQHSQFPLKQKHLLQFLNFRYPGKH